MQAQSEQGVPDMGKRVKAKENNSSHCVCLVIHACNALSFACQKNTIAVQFFAFKFLYLSLKTKCSFLLSTTV